MRQLVGSEGRNVTLSKRENLLVGLFVGTKDFGFEILRPNFVVAPTLPSGPNYSHRIHEQVNTRSEKLEGQ